MIATLASLLIGAATVSPAQVPARGSSEATLTLDRAGRVRVEATASAGAGGIVCTLTDRVRGPFESRTDRLLGRCRFELMLDAGIYLLRISGPAGAKADAKVSLAATLFEEQEKTPILLEPGQSIERALPDQKQSTIWVHASADRALSLRVTGRTAGHVALFREGVWLQDLHFEQRASQPGQPKEDRDWWFSQRIEAGDYTLVAYGNDPGPAPNGNGSTLVKISNGASVAGEEGTTALELDWTGSALVQLPAERTLLRARIAQAKKAARVALHTIGSDGAFNRSEEHGCTATLSEPCFLRSESAPAHLALITGEPGQRVELSWAPFGDEDGEFEFHDQRVFIAPESGDYLAGARMLPSPDGAAPLSCVLSDLVSAGAQASGLLAGSLVSHIVASNGLYLSVNRPYAAQFNWDGEEFDVHVHAATRMELHVQTDPERHSPCALLDRDTGARVSDENTDLTVSCGFVQQLAEGDYILRLYRGARGIQTLKLFDGSSPPPLSPPHSSCGMRVHLEKGARYSLAVSGGAAGEPLGFELRPAVMGALDGIAAWRPPEKKTPQPFAGRPEPIEQLALDRPLHFDFDRAQRRSLLVEVSGTGLYHATTEGLLATTCTLRTPMLTSVASDDSSGRGRNCLVAAMLQPGRYLLSVETEGESRGRLAVSLSARRAVSGPLLDAGSEAFFGVGEGELVSQKLHVQKGALFSLGTSARGVKLSCRLEDARGWPLEPSPTECMQQLFLEPGDYSWTQFPSTVESVRRTSLIAVAPPRLYTGRRIHALKLHAWHEAILSKRGHDAWFLNLPAELDVTFALTNGMQGRLYRIDPKNKSLHAIDVIPPEHGAEEAAAEIPPKPADEDEVSGSDAQTSAPQGDELNASTQEEESEPPPRHEDADDEAGESSEENCSGENCGTAQTQHARPPAPPPDPLQQNIAGSKTIHLAAGPYQLITEHSRGDVKVRYRLFAGSEVLVPGSQLARPVPSQSIVRVPLAAIVRIRTTGDADVRCQLFDASNKLIAESNGVGDDWNCGFAEPLQAGDYRLSIESELGESASTDLSISLLKSTASALLAKDQELTVSGVTTAEVPPPQGDSVREILLSAPAPFSCALERRDGTLLGERRNSTSCDLLVRDDSPLTLRLWTLDRPVEIHAQLRERRLINLEGEQIASDAIGRVKLSRAGRYSTGEDLFCLPESERGIFRDCSGKASLEAGAVLFATPGAEGKLQLEEVTVDDSEASRERTQASASVQLLAQTSSENALHLFAAENGADDLFAPSCSLDGGVRLFTSHGCYAASPIGKRALARWSVPDSTAHDLSLLRLSAPFPLEKRSIVLGPQQLNWTGLTARFSLPAAPARLELTLPRGAWAVLVDGTRPLDLCPPQDAMFSCALGSNGGELWLISPDESAASLEAIAGAPAPQALPLTDRFERAQPAPGPLTFSISADPRARTLEISGAAKCVLQEPDGERTIACSSTIAPGESAQLELVSTGAPLRIVLAASGDDEFGLGNLGPEQGALFPAGQASALGPQPFDRSIALDTDSFVHVRGDISVCALLDGATPLAISASGNSCVLDRFLSAGTYRLFARAFGETPLAGAIFWTQEPPIALSEGVGHESWIAPGESRLFRFTVRAPGKIGFGLQAEADSLECELRDRNWKLLGTGCQQFAPLNPGDDFVIVRAPATSAAQRIRPAVFGLEGAERGVPDEYLSDFFQRIGAAR